MWYDLLEKFGKTPAEWAEMDSHQRVFLEAAHSERLRRQNDEYS